MSAGLIITDNINDYIRRPVPAVCPPVQSCPANAQLQQARLGIRPNIDDNDAEKKELRDKVFQLTQELIKRKQEKCPSVQPELKVVVDEKNKPRVMYHGRNKDFESFDTGNVKTDTQEIGTHIGTAEQANEFATREGGNVVPTYLDVKNPLRLNDYGSFGSGEVLEQLRSTGKFNEDLLDEIENIPSIAERNKAVVDLIKSDGYDGIVYLNKREGLNLKGTEKQKSEKIDELQKKIVSQIRERKGLKAEESSE